MLIIVALIDAFTDMRFRPEALYIGAFILDIFLIGAAFS